MDAAELGVWAPGEEVSEGLSLSSLELSRTDRRALPLMRKLPDRLFREYQQLIYREAGIFLGPAKKALLMGLVGLGAVAANWAQIISRRSADSDRAPR